MKVLNSQFYQVHSSSEPLIVITNGRTDIDIRCFSAEYHVLFTLSDTGVGLVLEKPVS
jgi:hypothetical protein